MEDGDGWQRAREWEGKENKTKKKPLRIILWRSKMLLFYFIFANTNKKRCRVFVCVQIVSDGSKVYPYICLQVAANGQYNKRGWITRHVRIENATTRVEPLPMPFLLPLFAMHLSLFFHSISIQFEFMWKGNYEARGWVFSVHALHFFVHTVHIRIMFRFYEVFFSQSNKGIWFIYCTNERKTEFKMLDEFEWIPIKSIY